jgi:MFS family permease
MWGWQVAFLGAGLAGLVVGALTLLIAEPGRVTGSKQNLGRTGFLHYAARNSSSLLPVYLGGSLLAAIAYALGAWGAVHFIRSLGLPAAHVGYVMGMLTIVGVVIGGLSGGLISDALVKRRSSGRLDVLIVCACFSIPVLALWPLLPAAYAFTAFFGLMLAKAAVGTGTSTASVMIQEVVPSRMRGEALGYYFFVQGIIGPGLGPISVAMVSDHVFAGPGRLGAALIAVTVPAMLVVGALAWLGRTAYGRVWQVLSSDRADTWPDTQPHGALRN